jgi:hypothetical protein
MISLPVCSPMGPIMPRFVSISLTSLKGLGVSFRVARGSDYDVA